jgi:acetoin:2,6-dichlorophenolindophenol oxidoreductase subunit beta
MREMNISEAIREALREEMARDESVFLIGEDIGLIGGDFGVTRGLMEKFGASRVRDTPISESAILGTAIGAATNGLRPVAEIMFSDFLGVCMDMLLNQASKIRYMSGGQYKVPMVVRAPMGAGIRSSSQHSQSLEAIFMHIPGILIAMPSTAYDAKGLLKTAIRGDNPVLFLEHKLLYFIKTPVPEEEYLIPFGKADIKRSGGDVTIIATSLMVHRSLSAAAKLKDQGIDAEVIDLRTLVPLDKDAVLDSVKKTGRVVIVHEANKIGGAGAEIAAMIAEEAFDYLDAPIRRVATPNTPIPFCPPLEDYLLPNEEKIVKAVKGIVQG